MVLISLCGVCEVTGAGNACTCLCSRRLARDQNNSSNQYESVNALELNETQPTSLDAFDDVMDHDDEDVLEN